MSKKVLLIAGALLAVGSVAAISAPHFRGGGHMRHGPQGSIFGQGSGDLFGPQPARFGERLKEMDANKDGVITLDEFLARRKPTFARFDKNNDGAIDRDEFEAAASGDLRRFPAPRRDRHQPSLRSVPSGGIRNSAMLVVP